MTNFKVQSVGIYGETDENKKFEYAEKVVNLEMERTDKTEIGEYSADVVCRIDLEIFGEWLKENHFPELIEIQNVVTPNRIPLIRKGGSYIEPTTISEWIEMEIPHEVKVAAYAFIDAHIPQLKKATQYHFENYCRRISPNFKKYIAHDLKFDGACP